MIQTITTQELAQVLRVTPGALRGLIRRGVLPRGKLVAGRMLFTSVLANRACDKYLDHIMGGSR
ncbi:MAG: hypothetical protein JRL30_01205 [Deltaproteobacteria bacterium]|nr:hypothetical protein [Deltaproteobacteria bacterium]